MIDLVLTDGDETAFDLKRYRASRHASTQGIHTYAHDHLSYKALIHLALEKTVPLSSFHADVDTITKVTLHDGITEYDIERWVIVQPSPIHTIDSIGKYKLTCGHHRSASNR